MDSNKKDAEKRSEEVDRIMNQFLELGFAIDHPGVQAFIKTARLFAEEGIGASGTVRLDEYDRTLQYVLSTQSHIESRAVLEFTKKPRDAKKSRAAATGEPQPPKRKTKPQRMCRSKPILSVRSNLVAME